MLHTSWLAKKLMYVFAHFMSSQSWRQMKLQFRPGFDRTPPKIYCIAGESILLWSWVLLLLLAAVGNDDDGDDYDDDFCNIMSIATPATIDALLLLPSLFSFAYNEMPNFTSCVRQYTRKKAESTCKMFNGCDFFFGVWCAIVWIFTTDKYTRK